jgi:hypothetical protein
LREPHLFDFVATADTIPTVPGPSRQANWSALLCDFSDDDVCLFSRQGLTGGTLSERLQLGLGTYQFSISAGVFGSVVPQLPGTHVGTVDYDFTVNLTPTPSPVPEPASIALLSTGLIALVGRARKRGNGGSGRVVILPKFRGRLWPL